MKVKTTWKWGMTTTLKMKAIVEVHTDISVNPARKFCMNLTNILQVEVVQIGLAPVYVVVLPIALISIVVGVRGA